MKIQIPEKPNRKTRKTRSSSNTHTAELHDGVHVGLVLLDLLAIAQRLLGLVWVDVLGPAALHMIDAAILGLVAYRVHLVLGLVLGHLDADVDRIAQYEVLRGRLVRRYVHVQLGRPVAEVTLAAELRPLLRVNVHNLHPRRLTLACLPLLLPFNNLKSNRSLSLSLRRLFLSSRFLSSFYESKCNDCNESRRTITTTTTTTTKITTAVTTHKHKRPSRERRKKQTKRSSCKRKKTQQLLSLVCMCLCVCVC